jgi:hypothetical protein
MYFTLQNSVLASHLQTGSILVSLDDVALANRHDSQSPGDVWSTYLLDDQQFEPTLGWCINETIFLSKSRSFAT